MKRHLVVSSVGDHSQHRLWLQGGESFDLWLVYFGQQKERYRGQSQRHWQRAGSKWQNLHWLLQSESVKKYDYVFMPDDDLKLTGTVIDELFEIMKQYDLSLAQPAFSWGSQVTWPITLVRPWMTLRYTNFVENGAAAFSKRALQICKESFGTSLSGFGLDFVWQNLLQSEKIAIVDATLCTHPQRISELDELQPRQQQRNEGLKLLEGVPHELPREMGFALNAAGVDMKRSGRTASQIRRQAEYLFNYSRQ